ncbi:ABC transporter permease [Streptomyces sp. NPDC005322]|uniref:ABC transporter permease n=1 Tax=unclassified Streptomyces TaxID=2593676 RepID=UPI0033BF54C5
MLSVAVCTLRTRWVTFVGSFVALALGVGLIATMGLALASTLSAPERGPERFARAPVVVRGADTLRVPSPVGVRVKPLAQPRPVSVELADRLARVGKTVPDRGFGLGGGKVGRPWSTAAFAPYRLTSGRAPATAGEVVVMGDRAEPSRRLTLAGATRTVVGTVTGPGVEQAVFFGDAEAARLAPRIDNLVVEAPAAAVRKALKGAPGSAGVQVLTGNDRRLADPDPDRDHEALVSVNALLGTAAGVTGFVSVFVVASTFAFAVAQRRREFGLLRAAGATPRQVRRLVFAEAAAVGALASAAGCVLGASGAPRLASWLVDAEVAPAWFTVGEGNWPYYVAFSAGVLVAMAGVWAASRRAGKVGPAEALREAAVDRRTMTPGRWVAGAILLCMGIGLVVWRLATDPGEILHRKTYTIQPMVLITACALLAPVLVRPLTRVLAWLPARLPGATGMLARENAAAGVRRTAAIGAPVLITVALTGSLLGASATINDAKASEIRTRTAADFVVTASDPSGLGRRAVARVERVPGTIAAPLAPTAVSTMEDGVALVQDQALAVEAAALAAVEKPPVVSGRVTDLDDRSIIVNEGWARHTVGETVGVWLGDGRKARLRIAAVMRAGTGNNGVYVTPRNAAGAAPDRIDVRLRPGADPATVAAALRETVRPSDGHVHSREQWVAASHPRTSRQTRLGFLVVLGIALLYAGIALANTQVMAVSDRVRELAVLRLVGATNQQVLRIVAAEALMAVGVGAVLGAVVAGGNLLAIRAALGRVSVHSSIVVPWETVGTAVAVCAVLAVVSAVLPARLALRTRPVELAGMRE